MKGKRVMNSNQEKKDTIRPPWHPYVSGVIGLIFGPIAGALVTCINLKILGHQVKAIFTLLLTFIGTAALIEMILRSPEQLNNLVIINIGSSLIFIIIQWYDYEEWSYKNSGVKTHSGLKSVGWGIAGSITYSVLIFILLIITPVEIIGSGYSVAEANYDNAASVQPTSDGGYILVGETESFGVGGYKAWLIKIEPNGDQKWSKTLGGTGDGSANEILQTSDGGYILAGGTASYKPGDYDFWLVKTDVNGNQQWSKTFGKNMT